MGRRQSNTAQTSPAAGSGRRSSRGATAATTTAAAAAGAGSGSGRRRSATPKSKAKAKDVFEFDEGDVIPPPPIAHAANTPKRVSGGSSSGGGNRSRPASSQKKKQASAPGRDRRRVGSGSVASAGRTASPVSIIGAAVTPTATPRRRPTTTSILATPNTIRSPQARAATAAPTAASFTTPLRLSARASTPPRFGSEIKAANVAATTATAAPVAAAAAAAASPAVRSRPAPAATPAPVVASTIPLTIRRRSRVSTHSTSAAALSSSSRSETPSPTDAWAAVLAKGAAAGHVVSAPAAALEVLHSWQSDYSTRGSPRKRRASQSPASKRAAVAAEEKKEEKEAEEEEEPEEEQEEEQASPAKKRKSEKVVREGARRSSRHADEPRRSLKESDLVEQGVEAGEARWQSRAAVEAAAQTEPDATRWDIDLDDEGSVAASSKATPSRSRRTHRRAATVAAPAAHVPSAAESEQLDKMARFFEQIDNQAMDDVFEVVALRKEPHVLRSPLGAKV